MRGFVALLIVVAITGCTYVNKPLNDDSVPLESRKLNQTRAVGRAAQGQITNSSDGCFVGLAISGGGLRSANFGAACMFQLQRMNLLRKVNYISAVSGGALPAAYYCLYDDTHWNPGNLQRKLTHAFGTDIVLTAVQPWNAAALMFTDWDSTDVLAASLDGVLFRRGGRSLTFADLRDDRPRLLINATDLQSGKGFMFCNESFDELNSDLGKYPIAHAVAASSAVPVVLHPKTLRDFSTSFKQYRHFIDGGVTDNLGVQSLVDVYLAQNGGGPGQAVPYPKGAIIFVIDAGTRYDANLSDKGDIGFWEKIRRSTDLAATALIARANSATLGDLILLHAGKSLTAEDLRAKKQELQEKGFVEIEDQNQRPIQVIHLSLTNVRRLSNVPFPSFSESIDSISTLYNIERKEAHLLYQAAELLIRDGAMGEALESVGKKLNVEP